MEMILNSLGKILLRVRLGNVNDQKRTALEALGWEQSWDLLSIFDQSHFICKIDNIDDSFSIDEVLLPEISEFDVSSTVVNMKS